MKFGDLSDGCSSDSCPSEDNLDERDMAKLFPVKTKTASKPKAKQTIPKIKTP